MKDKADELIKMKIRKKISYYFSPLWLRIMILILLQLAGGLNIHAQRHDKKSGNKRFTCSELKIYY